MTNYYSRIFVIVFSIYSNISLAQIRFPESAKEEFKISICTYTGNWNELESIIFLRIDSNISFPPEIKELADLNEDNYTWYRNNKLQSPDYSYNIESLELSQSVMKIYYFLSEDLLNETPATLNEDFAKSKELNKLLQQEKKPFIGYVVECKDKTDKHNQPFYIWYTREWCLVGWGIRL